MSNLAKSNIFSAYLLYIIKVIVISLILFNFNKVFAEEASVDVEPFEIWGQTTNQSIPQLENSQLEEEVIEDEVVGSESNNSLADINGDGQINVIDVVFLVNLILSE